MIRNLDNLEKILRQKVIDSEISINKIAKITGLPQSRLSDFKNGKWNFPLRKLNTLANYFEVKFRLENWPD